MADPKIAPDVADRVYQIARTYVLTRTERKSGIAWKEFKEQRGGDASGGDQAPQKYRDARESVTTNAFLRVRACRSREDFVDYFTGTLCSVPQYLPQTEFAEVSRVLLDEQQWEDVKSLTMLALSALSRV
jgi:CRISPR-associated protein Cmx8